MTIIKKFVSADGKEFNTKRECQRHDVKVAIARLAGLDKVDPIVRGGILNQIMDNAQAVAKLARKKARLDKV